MTPLSDEVLRTTLLNHDEQVVVDAINGGLQTSLSISGVPLIVFAAECGLARAVQVLISHRTDVAQRDFYGRTALHAAASSTWPANVTIIHELIAGGAPINAPDL